MIDFSHINGELELVLNDTLGADLYIPLSHFLKVKSPFKRH